MSNNNETTWCGKTLITRKQYDKKHLQLQSTRKQIRINKIYRDKLDLTTKYPNYDKGHYSLEEGYLTCFVCRKTMSYNDDNFYSCRVCAYDYCKSCKDLCKNVTKVPDAELEFRKQNDRSDEDCSDSKYFCIVHRKSKISEKK